MRPQNPPNIAHLKLLINQGQLAQKSDTIYFVNTKTNILTHTSIGLFYFPPVIMSFIDNDTIPRYHTFKYELISGRNYILQL